MKRITNLETTELDNNNISKSEELDKRIETLPNICEESVNEKLQSSNKNDSMIVKMCEDAMKEITPLKMTESAKSKINNNSNTIKLIATKTNLPKQDANQSETLNSFVKPQQFNNSIQQDSSTSTKSKSSSITTIESNEDITNLSSVFKNIFGDEKQLNDFSNFFDLDDNNVNNDETAVDFISQLSENVEITNNEQIKTTKELEAIFKLSESEDNHSDHDNDSSMSICDLVIDEDVNNIMEHKYEINKDHQMAIEVNVEPKKRARKRKAVSQFIPCQRSLRSSVKKVFNDCIQNFENVENISKKRIRKCDDIYNSSNKSDQNYIQTRSRTRYNSGQSIDSNVYETTLIAPQQCGIVDEELSASLNTCKTTTISNTIYNKLSATPNAFESTTKSHKSTYNIVEGVPVSLNGYVDITKSHQLPNTIDKEVPASLNASECITKSAQSTDNINEEQLPSPNAFECTEKSQQSTENVDEKSHRSPSTPEYITKSPQPTDNINEEQLPSPNAFEYTEKSPQSTGNIVEESHGSPSTPEYRTKSPQSTDNINEEQLPSPNAFECIETPPQSTRNIHEESPASPNTSKTTSTDTTYDESLVSSNNSTSQLSDAESPNNIHEVSPASPKSEDFNENFIPINIPLELNSSYHRYDETILQNFIRNYQYSEYNRRIGNFPKQEKRTREQKLNQLNEDLKNYLYNEPIDNDHEAEELIYKFDHTTNDLDLILQVIIEQMKTVPRPEKELNCTVEDVPHKYLGKYHHRIIFLFKHLHQKNAQLHTLLLHKLECSLFSLKKITDDAALNLLQLYLIVISNYEIKYSNPARLLITSILYYYGKMNVSVPMIFEVLCCYPTVLPKYYDTHDDALLLVIQHRLMCLSYAVTLQGYRMKELLSKLRFEYFFKPYEPSRNYMLDFLLEKLKNNQLDNLVYCYALICKNNDTKFVIDIVLAEQLVPLANDYFRKVTETDEYDQRIAVLLECIAIVTKPLPIEMDVKTLLNLFSTYMKIVERACVQEAAVRAIIKLQRFGYVNCFQILKEYNPKYKPMPMTMAALKTFVYRKVLNFWKQIV